MTEPATLTLTSFLHGERTWRRIGEREHIRRDGRQTTLARWRSSCTICGAAFEIETAASVQAVEQTKRFLGTTCELHRLTPSEVARLRFAKRDQRRAIFAALKRRKLENPVVSPAPPAPPSRTQSPVRASGPTACQPHPLSSPEGRERAEQILRFRAEHRAEQLSDKQIAAAVELREREEDDELAARLESFRCPKPPLPN